MIQTPDRRPRVFVSSTLGELAEERRAFAAGSALTQQQAVTTVRDHRRVGAHMLQGHHA
jgi:hypothetical protein